MRVFLKRNHLILSLEHSNNNKIRETLNMESEERKFKSVGIQFVIDAESNELLEKSASASDRTKKAECRLRLADHLRRFPSITKVGLCEEK